MTSKKKGIKSKGVFSLLGPAFVAAIAYVDPGNVAANLTAGAQYGYLLIWVLVLSNAMAVIVQYLSAKLGIITKNSLSEILAQRLGRKARIAFWLQAEIISIATDLAEIIGGAIAFQLLCGLPLIIGGLLTGAISLVMLLVKERYGQKSFELLITVFLLLLSIGFCAGLFISPPNWQEAAGGLVPGFEGTPSLLLAVSMLGATVMPHAVYVHSALTRDRHGASDSDQKLLLKATRIDVILALLLAGSVNIGMLLLAATNLPGAEGTDTITGAQHVITYVLGPGIGLLFAIGLLLSGLASTSVGCYAGAEVMQSLIQFRIPLIIRRLITLIPGIFLLATEISPTWLLILSQVILSFGIPFALFPLVQLTKDPLLMKGLNNHPLLTYVGWLIAIVITGLNGILIYLVLS